MKKRIVIFYGGPGLEKKVSEKSATTVFSVLDKQKYNVEKIFVNEHKDFFYKDKKIESFSEFSKKIDIAIPMIHGEFGEDGEIQKFFERNNITFLGSGVEASKNTANKDITNKIFIKNNILTPQSIILKKKEYKEDDFDFIGILSKFKKIIVKPVSGGSSFGISICDDIESLKTSIKKGFLADDTILIEKFISGKEFTCGVVKNPKKLKGNIALAVVEIKCPGKEFFDFEAKYEGASEEICPAKISEELSKNIKNTSLNIFNIFKLEDLARIDYIVDDQGNIFALDVNTIPGMTVVSLLPQELEQEGISLEEFFNALIQHKLR